MSSATPPSPVTTTPSASSTTLQPSPSVYPQATPPTASAPVNPPTFINNHFEHDLGIFTPDIELGIGDSSGLINARIHQSYTSVGTLAHFQAGTSIDLPFNASFEADAYEELPVAASTIYSTTGKGKKKVTTATGTSVAEDNGFITSLDIPVNGHVILSGFYNRSLRDHDDASGILLHLPPQSPAAPRSNALINPHAVK